MVLTCPSCLRSVVEEDEYEMEPLDLTCPKCLQNERFDRQSEKDAEYDYCGMEIE